MNSEKYGVGLKREGSRKHKKLVLLDGIGGRLVDDYIFESVKRRGEGRNVKLANLGSIVVMDSFPISEDTILRGYFNKDGLLCYNAGSQKDNETLFSLLGGIVQHLYGIDDRRIVVAEHRYRENAFDFDILSFFNLVGIGGNGTQAAYDEVHDWAMRKWGLKPLE